MFKVVHWYFLKENKWYLMLSEVGYFQYPPMITQKKSEESDDNNKTIIESRLGSPSSMLDSLVISKNV